MSWAPALKISAHSDEFCGRGNLLIEGRSSKKNHKKFLQRPFPMRFSPMSRKRSLLLCYAKFLPLLGYTLIYAN